MQLYDYSDVSEDIMTYVRKLACANHDEAQQNVNQTV